MNERDNENKNDIFLYQISRKWNVKTMMMNDRDDEADDTGFFSLCMQSRYFR